MKRIKILLLRMVMAGRSVAGGLRSNFSGTLGELVEAVRAKIPAAYLIRSLIVWGLFFIVLIAVLFSNAFEALSAYYTEEVPETGGTYREAVIGEFSRLNPLYAETQADQDAITLLYSGLLRFNEEREIVPDLAERYEVDKTGKIYTVYLRRDVAWHDGRPFTAADVLFTFKMIQSDEARSPLQPIWRGVRIEKVDDYTVRFLLPNPLAPFLSLLSEKIIAEHQFRAVEPKNLKLSEVNRHPIGTGPFRFDTHLEDEGVVRLRANTRYHRKEKNRSRPFLDAIELHAYDSESEAFDAYARREVDGVAKISTSDLGRAVKFEALALYPLELPQYATLFLNMRSAVLGNKAVREAIDAAVDREELIQKVYAGEAFTVFAPILPGYLGYDHRIGRRPRSLARAEELLEQAGWKREGEKRVKEGKVLRLDLVTVNKPENRALAERIKRQLEAAGIELELQIRETGELEESYIRPRSFDLFLASVFLGADPDPYGLWHSSQKEDPGLNFSGYGTDQTDALIEGGRRSSDAPTRAAKYQKFQELLVGDTPAVFLLSPLHYYGVTQEVKGVFPSGVTRLTDPRLRFVNVFDWYIQTKRVQRNALKATRVS